MGLARLRLLIPAARNGWMTLLLRLVPSGVRPLYWTCTHHACRRYTEIHDGAACWRSS